MSEALSQGDESIQKLVIQYLLPYRLLTLIKAQFKDREKRPIDPAFTYHILWIMGAIYERKIQYKPDKVDQLEDYIPKMVFEPYFSKIAEEYKACLKYRKDLMIPRSLKSEPDLAKFEDVMRTFTS